MSSTMYQSPYKPTPTSTPFDVFMRWLRLKKYRIEVTYGIYVFTPGEKAVFWTLFCLFFAVVWSALALYTQRSLAFLVRLVCSTVFTHGAEILHGAARNSPIA
ncbi:hypothetical protein GGR50DRAFT_609592 [Xylaria sp. CBS 124048]|nr:hypothetical protein GGR50DRAFT_609592 [Xylaria sp. CBS 124048]